MTQDEKDYIDVSQHFIGSLKCALRYSQNIVDSNAVQMDILKASTAIEKRRVIIERRRIANAEKELEAYKASIK